MRTAARTTRTARPSGAARTLTGTRREVQRLSSEDLAFCTCGQCRAGDPVRSVNGGYLTEEVPDDPEVFPVIMLPPHADLATQARRLPLIDDALRLAGWCTPGREVTAKGVLRPSVARQAIEELRLWQRDDRLADPHTRADALASLRSAADIAVLDAPWRFASGNGLIAIRSNRAVPGADVPDPDDADQLLSCWQGAFEQELGVLDDLGGQILPGMLSMFGGQFGSVVFPVLKLLYRLPGEEWLDIGSLMSSLGADGGGSSTPLQDVFVIQSTVRLMNILSDFGAVDADLGDSQWSSDEAVAVMLFTDRRPAKPDYRMRLTPLGRYGIRNILASEGHTARVAGELADADAATLLDALPDYDTAGSHTGGSGTAGFDTEVSGWLAGRDEASAVTQLLEAVPGTDPGLAARRVSAIAVLTRIKPDEARAILREVAANGPDGRRHVAAGVIANLGEEPPSYRHTVQQWLLVDQLTALCAGNLRENLTQSTLEAIRPYADDLWRSDHPATADTIEAIAAAIRDIDKALAKRLRRCAHKARTRG